MSFGGFAIVCLSNGSPSTPAAPPPPPPAEEQKPGTTGDAAMRKKRQQQAGLAGTIQTSGMGTSGAPQATGPAKTKLGE